MMTRRHANAGLVSAAILASASDARALEQKIRELPLPRATGGKPLTENTLIARCRRKCCPICCGLRSA